MQASIVERDAAFALHVTCADDGERHLVRDDLATAALVFGQQVSALCGHKVSIGSMINRPGHPCTVCPRVAVVAGLAAP